MTTFLKATQIPTHGAMTLPGESFTSPEVFQAEMERIFRRRWLCAGRASEIARAGEFVVRSFGSESVILTRDQTGAPRAFHNVCRHRGARLCEETRGEFKGGIRCPYHAWTYGLDGCLQGAPHMSAAEGFDKADFPLHSVAIAEWEGFIFINLSSDPEPFEEAFAPLIGRFTRFGMPALVTAERIEYDVKANWKLIHQNYSECDHCSPVHPALVRITPASSGQNDLFDGPFLGGYMVIAKEGGSLTMSGRVCGVTVGDLPPEDMDRVYYYSIFPNMLLSLHPDYVMAHMIWPESPGRTRITCDWLFHPATLGDPSLDPKDGVAFWDMTNRQDWHVCEISQLGVSSSGYTPGPYSPRESLAAAFDREVNKAMEME